MPPHFRSLVAAAGLVVAALAAHAVPAAAQGTPPLAGAARARADSARLPWTEADVGFLQGMIAHHAQAIAMSRLAPTHDASPAVRTLAARIANAQRDEIALMRQWLRDRGRESPEPDTTLAAQGVGAATPAPAGAHGAHGTHGTHEHGPPASGGHGTHADHGAHADMPGMLTPAQLAELDRARGAAFDVRFLELMIQHHKGAVAMTRALFSTPGAGQDLTVSRLAMDVRVDQTTEVARMQRMLLQLRLGIATP